MTQAWPTPAGRRRDVLLGVATVAYLAGATHLLASPLRPVDRVNLVQTFALFACGVLIVRRTDTPLIGWLLIVPGIMFNPLNSTVAAVEAGRPGAGLVSPLFNLGVGALALLVLVFPTGRFPSTASRVAAGIAVVGMTGQGALDYLTAFGIVAGTGNPLVPVGMIGFVGYFAAIIIGFVDQAVRYRRRPRVEQLQLKWFLVAIVGQLGYVALIAAGIGPETMVFVAVDNVVTTLWPVTILVAISRYRLYEIDRIVSRAVAYVLVLGSLALLFVVMVSLVTAWLPAQDQFAVAATTLAVVALFNPLRRRVVEVVDRRFNRTRYVSQQVIERFGRTVQDHTDLDDVHDRVHAVIGETIAPRTVAVWQPAARGSTP